MALIHDLIIHNLPLRARKTPRDWLVFNAVCCHHNGHNPDTRSRGNMIIIPDGTMGYNCYNCGFRTRFNGKDLSRNFENLMRWFGIDSNAINEVKIELLRRKLDGIDEALPGIDIAFTREFKEVELPPETISMGGVLEWDSIPPEFVNVLSYLSSRGAAVANNYDYHWSSGTKHDMCHRVIIPFRYQHMIVGWTARYAGIPPKGVPRYYNSALQPGYLFNNDALEYRDRRVVLLLEGPFDAIAVDGVAALGSELSKEQIAWLISCGKEIVVVPDRQRKNQGLIDAALEQGWSVSFPEWEDGIKDAAQASARYGRIYTIQSILNSRTDSKLKINIKRQMFRG